jgi:hypothetical protein
LLKIYLSGPIQLSEHEFSCEVFVAKPVDRKMKCFGIDAFMAIEAALRAAKVLVETGIPASMEILWLDGSKFIEPWPLP